MKRLIVCLMLALCLISVSSVLAYEVTYDIEYFTSAEGLEIKSLKYEPYPAEPGEIIKAYITIKNVGDEIAQDATCEIVDNNIFHPYGKSSFSFGSLRPGSELSFEFEVKVNENVLERTEDLEVRCSGRPSAGIWLGHKIPIKIEYRFTTINIDDVKTNPEMLEIGKEGEIIISIANNAASALRDVAVELDFATTQIAPADGTTIRKISNIKSNEVMDLTFNVLTLPDTEPNVYKIPLIVNYTDINGEIQTFSTLLAISIGEKPSYYVVPASYKKLGGTSKLIELKFVNNGLADMQFFNVKNLKTGENIYIGDLDSDDYITEEITISSIWSKTTIPLEITYKDKLNKDYKDTVNLEFNAKKVKDLTETSSYSRIIFLLIVGGIAYYLYRRHKRKG
jgi:hypothetical protein